MIYIHNWLLEYDSVSFLFPLFGITSISHRQALGLSAHRLHPITTYKATKALSLTPLSYPYSCLKIDGDLDNCNALHFSCFEENNCTMSNSHISLCKIPINNLNSDYWDVYLNWYLFPKCRFQSISLNSNRVH